MSNKDVAAQCWISPRTVAFHLRNVFAKAGVTSRGELARSTWAEEPGWGWRAARGRSRIGNHHLDEERDHDRHRRLRVDRTLSARR